MTKVQAHFYVDGSYNEEHNIAAGALIVVDPVTQQVLDKESKIVTTQGVENLTKRRLIEEALAGRNIAGEIEGVKLALKYALKNGYKHVAIYHDYAGLAHWATGNWKANQPYTKAYAEAIQTISKSVKIDFIKVKGHSGNTFNNSADGLASQAIKEYISENNLDIKASAKEKAQALEWLED